jgi:hypothetical protein
MTRYLIALCVALEIEGASPQAVAARTAAAIRRAGFPAETHPRVATLTAADIDDARLYPGDHFLVEASGAGPSQRRRLLPHDHRLCAASECGLAGHTHLLVRLGDTWYCPPHAAAAARAARQPPSSVSGAPNPAGGADKVGLPAPPDSGGGRQ